MGAPLVEWAVAERALPGQSESGDASVVVPLEGALLAAVVDGLGHGSEAATAARVAIETLQAHAGEPLEALLRTCHQALLKTRGVVVSVALFRAEDETVTLLGVGNVEGILLRADPRKKRETVLLRGGVVGYQLPPLRASVLAISPGDTLILATDGVQSGFVSTLSPFGAPQSMADGLLARYAKDSDDALALVIRYLGRGP